MKKRVLGIVLALVMALTLVPTTAFAADFTDWTELKSGNYNLGIGKYYLTSDVTMNELFRIQSHANVTIDLNGHVLDAEWGVRVGMYGSLTIQDSAPTALHTGSNAELPAGGVIRCKYDYFDVGVDSFGAKYPATLYLNGGTIMGFPVNVMDGSKLYMSGTARIKSGKVDFRTSGTYEKETTLYANGGVIDGEVTGFGIIENTASTVTSFYEEVTDNVKIQGGLFYGTIYDKSKAGTTVTYISDGVTYATQILPANGKAAEPDAPKKDGCIFTGWLRADGTSFEFNTPITENTTLTAGWFDPTTIGSPQLKIGEDNLWYVSYDDGKTWTSLGVKATGATGATGEKGDKGDKGDTGTQGEKGDKGDKGDTGATGEKGDKGDKGDTGAQGEKGDKGDKGDTGATGEKGDKGDTGDTGAQGEKGDKGDKGDTGATGEKGDKGDKGDTGEKGEKGDKGDKGDTGATGEKGDKGDTGAAGQDGITPLFRVNLETNKWEISYDNGNTWTAYAQATGDKGDKGNQGEKGDKGDKGDPGLIPYIGVNGNWWLGATDTGVAATGPKGDKGDPGATGATGSTGATGATGAAGAAGRDGRDGLNGQDGVGIVSAEINADGNLILTYTNGETTDLGVVVGADGLTPFIGDNGNWWIGELDTGVKAAASSEVASPVTIVIGVAAGLALVGNIALALTLRSVLKKKELV